ncbi:MAG: hypothetical protein JWN34_615 [Bryobacterales bacterium]|nr:hypothetical protein [Bryobacterales bacterium]
MPESVSGIRLERCERIQSSHHEGARQKPFGDIDGFCPCPAANISGNLRLCWICPSRWPFEQPAALSKIAENIVAQGTVSVEAPVQLRRTCAGIAAAAAQDWHRVERPHTYRAADHLYAEMLLARGIGDDHQQSELLSTEALRLSNEDRNAWYRERARQRLWPPSQ